ncbi:HNH endonuclease [Microbacterium luticocti]|uniref:HNH endonuclease n=1 Tax=Microbacterium luticocti TaxID=451764 RepID=UPI00041D265B
MGTRHTRAYTDLREQLRDWWARTNAPCWLCGQPIDYDAPAHDPAALDLDHAKPIETHPHLALDSSNCRPSHCRCNRSRGSRAPRPEMGMVTEDW